MRTAATVRRCVSLSNVCWEEDGAQNHTAGAEGVPPLRMHAGCIDFVSQHAQLVH
jgi:hypothetical protein